MRKRLHAKGFTDSVYDRQSRTWRVRCPSCATLVINGVPCHEEGCPNIPPRDNLR